MCDVKYQSLYTGYFLCVFYLLFIHFSLFLSFRSVAACEDTVKKLYSLLEWEYSDTDLDDDNNQASCGKAKLN